MSVNTYKHCRERYRESLQQTFYPLEVDRRATYYADLEFVEGHLYRHMFT